MKFLRLFFINILLVTNLWCHEDATAKFIQDGTKPMLMDSCQNKIGSLRQYQQIICGEGKLMLHYDASEEIRNSDDTLIFFIYTDSLRPKQSIIRYVDDTILILKSLSFEFYRNYYIGAHLGVSNHNGGIDYNSSCIKESYGYQFIFKEKPDLNLFSLYLTPKNEYVFILEINNGKMPYQVLSVNGEIDSMHHKYLISYPQANFSPNLFSIADSNGCSDTVTIDKSTNLNCGSINAGLLDTIETRVCEDECIPIKNLISEIIDPSIQTRMFILHTGHYWKSGIVDTFYNINDLICLKNYPQLISETDYYITRVVGLDLFPTDGIVDITDPCIRVSLPQSIVFSNYPISDPGPSENVCNKKIRLRASMSFGNGTWAKVSGPGKAVFEDITNPNTIVEVSEYGQYLFQWSIFNRSCESVSTVVIGLYAKPHAKITSSTNFIPRNGKLTLSALKSNQGSGFKTEYLWSTKNGSFVNKNDSTKSEIVINKPGTYQLKILDSLTGCADLIYKTILIDNRDTVKRKDDDGLQTQVNQLVSEDDSSFDQSQDVFDLNALNSTQILNHNVDELTIYNLIGQEVLHTKNKNTIYQTQIENLPPGFYIALISSHNANFAIYRYSIKFWKKS